jgi:hypothetical protein
MAWCWVLAAWRTRFGAVRVQPSAAHRLHAGSSPNFLAPPLPRLQPYLTAALPLLGRHNPCRSAIRAAAAACV